jgi:hypothetical protein
MLGLAARVRKGHMLPGYRSDDICEVCPPGRRPTFAGADRVNHWRREHPQQLAWQLAKLRDGRDGFGWRADPAGGQRPVARVVPHMQARRGSSEQIYSRGAPNSSHYVEVVVVV